MMPFQHVLVGDVRLVVTVPGRPSDLELKQHLEEAQTMLRSTRVALIVSGGDLTPRERMQMAQAGLFRPKTAVLTNSFFSRGILTAIRWMGGINKGFGPSQFSEACDFLDITLAQREDLARHIVILKGRLPSPHPHDVILGTKMPVDVSRLSGRSTRTGTKG